MSINPMQQETLDPEALALSRVISALSNIDQEAQNRIIRLVIDKFKLTAPIKQSDKLMGAEAQRTKSTITASDFTDVSDLFEQAKPSLGIDRALVAGYWFQICQNKENFTGLEINTSLKDLGHASANITTDMTNLINKSPSLIQQVAKTGKAQQGRKKYKVTRAGISYVEKMLAGEISSSED